MAGSSSDLITKTTNGSRPVPTTVTGTRSAGGTTLACAALTGWETGTTGVHFATYRTDANNNVVAGSQCDWEGVVSGTNITNLVLKAGTDAGNSIGDVVAPIITAAWGDGIAQGILAEHTTAGLHVMARPKVTTSIDDTNGNELVKFSSTTSAVNEFTVTNAATGNSPQLSATGGDTNIDVAMTPKGTGLLKVGGVPMQHNAWVSWSPTWTNLTVGNATTSYKYCQLGKTIFYRIDITLGSTSSVGTAPEFSLPVTSVSLPGTVVQQPLGSLIMYDTSASGQIFGTIVWRSTTSARLLILDDGGAGLGSSNVSSTTPFTWTTGDEIHISGFYEAA